MEVPFKIENRLQVDCLIFEDSTETGNVVALRTEARDLFRAFNTRQTIFVPSGQRAERCTMYM